MQLFAADYADLNHWSLAGNGPASFRVIREIRGQNLGLTTCPCALSPGWPFSA